MYSPLHIEQPSADSKFCITGKLKHKTMLGAQQTLDQMMQDPQVSGKEKLGIYTCSECGTFHIGRSSINK